MANLAILPPEPEWGGAFAPSGEEARRHPERVIQQGYEDVPILKPPVWGWEIASYFFVEGLSAGIYTIGTIADVFGARRCKETVTRGRMLALFGMMPAPGLLIHDLGRPERFHHMLRIIKPRSPMNLGSWALTGYAIFTTTRALLGLRDRLHDVPVLGKVLARIPERVASLAGVPFALVMLSYPGVLLSSTSTPVRAQTHFLGALIACSSISTAAAGMSIIAEWTDDAVARKAMKRIEHVVVVAEAASLIAYLATAKKAARPLVKAGNQRCFGWAVSLRGLSFLRCCARGASGGRLSSPRRWRWLADMRSSGPLCTPDASPRWIASCRAEMGHRTSPIPMRS